MLNVVVVDDVEDLVILMEVVLMEHANVRKVSNNFGICLTPELWDGVDAAIIDLQLGQADITGQDILVYLREHHPEVRRVVLSAVNQFYDLEEGLCDVRLSKPASFNEILAAVGTHA